MSITKSKIAHVMKVSPAPSYLSKALYTLTLSSCNEKIRLINSLWVIINASLNALRQWIFLKNRNINIDITKNGCQKNARSWKSPGVQVAQRRGELGAIVNMADDMEFSRNLTYKEIHERFVSDLNGTSLMEVSLVASTAPVAVFLRTFMFSLLFLNEKAKRSRWLFCL